jgi:hypothetical protein
MLLRSREQLFYGTDLTALKFGSPLYYRINVPSVNKLGSRSVKVTPIVELKG